MTYHLHLTIASHRKRLRSYILPMLLLTGSLISAGGALTTAAEDMPATTTSSAVIINEVKTGGNSTQFPQYVTLYNQSSAPISLAGWKLEYAKAGFPASQCSAPNWEEVSKSLTEVVNLTGNLASASATDFLAISMTDNMAGSVRLTGPSGDVADLVGWGSGAFPAPCYETEQTAALTNDKGLVRYLDCANSIPVDTNNNAADFLLTNTTVSGEATATQLPECTASEEPEEATAGCENVRLSELLPNPGGTDTGHEFIELRNIASSSVDLSACSLQTSANDKAFTLTGLTLQPEEHRAIGDTQSGLTLANSSGGTVWLLNETDELQAISYPAGMEDDTAWTFADGQWAASFTPTPGTANLLTITRPCPEGQIRNSETNRCTAANSSQTGLTSCDAGQERNPETNRCRAITNSASNTTCPAGQIRNPDTNRCRSSAVAVSSQAACKPGQERNPETNRCRNATTTGASKPCPTGQERNPETNRCRKISAIANSQNGGGLGGVQDVATNSQQQSKPYWLIAAALLLGAIGYAVYEWRQEIRLLAGKLLTRLRDREQTFASHGTK